VTVADYGCAAGHLAKGLQKSGLRVTYQGFDISPEYLDIARHHFPNYQFSIADLTSQSDIALLPSTNIAVMSATIEHLRDPFGLLKHLFKNTTDLIIIRTFVGDESRQDWVKKRDALESYLCRQFRLDELHIDEAWEMKVYKDEATNGESRLLQGLEQKDVLRRMAFVTFWAGERGVSTR
jgi:SAM-dependent methyltransferase